MSPVVRQRLPPTVGPHFQTESQPYWQRREVDGAAGGLQRLVHFLVGVVHHLVLLCLVAGRGLLHDVVVAAEVVLEIVDAPGA